LLVFGGSLGAQAINDWVWGSLTALLARYQVVHIVGAGNINTSIGLEQRAGQTTGPIQNSSVPHYCQKEFLQAEFGDVLAAADLVLSRAGANSIYELLLMRKPHILVPLTARASRGDQIINARIFESKGMSQVVDEDRLTSTDIVQVIEKTIENQSRQLAAIANFEIIDSVSVITELLERTRR
jgi:UDP-N-acetylglucosamine--N-acetylmuramyl-(pentapeptide) pyrophosphoryl-undecaprenol N-acetylglucosamine transferase